MLLLLIYVPTHYKIFQLTLNAFYTTLWILKIPYVPICQQHLCIWDLRNHLIRYVDVYAYIWIPITRKSEKNNATSFTSSSTSFWCQFLNLRLTYCFNHHFFIIRFSTLLIHNFLSFSISGLKRTCCTNPTHTPVVSLLHPRLPSRTTAPARTVSSELFGFLFLVFPYLFVSVPCARLSWPSCQLFSVWKYIVSYRIVS